jgi:methylisocitrate lyase
VVHVCERLDLKQIVCAKATGSTDATEIVAEQIEARVAATQAFEQRQRVGTIGKADSIHCDGRLRPVRSVVPLANTIYSWRIMGTASDRVEESAEAFIALPPLRPETDTRCARSSVRRTRMTNQSSAGRRLRDAIAEERPLQVVGAINAYSAMLAERVGYKSLYLSGAGVANASFGLPDLGMTSLDDVLEDVRRITSASSLPLLVDIDTGWGGAFNIARTIKAMTRAGAAAVHIEDQVAQKRCGHRPNKAIVPISEMTDRIKAAVDAKLDSDFIVMARTDALAVDGFDAVLERVSAFVEAGADAIFAEAMTDLSMYQRVVSTVDVPVLANITEFGQTPLFTTKELGSVGIAMALYPLSAFRAASQAALNVYRAIRTEGTQKNVVSAMQTRMDLYDFLGYHDYERKLDELFKNEESREAL